MCYKNVALVYKELQVITLTTLIYKTQGYHMKAIAEFLPSSSITL